MNTHCHYCSATIGDAALKAGQVYFCSAECFHLGDGDAIEYQAKLPDANSPFGHARQQIGKLLIENAELKRQVDQLIKNGLSPEAKEQIEAVVKLLPVQAAQEKLHRLRAAVEHYRQIGALQHSYKCTLKQCVCGLDNIFNNL